MIPIISFFMVTSCFRSTSGHCEGVSPKQSHPQFRIASGLRALKRCDPRSDFHDSSFADSLHSLFVIRHSYASTSRTLTREALRAGSRLASTARTLAMTSHMPRPFKE